MRYPFMNLEPEMDTVVYVVKPGDTLINIIRNYYGPLPPAQQEALIRSIQAANPREPLINSDVSLRGLKRADARRASQ